MNTLRRSGRSLIRHLLAPGVLAGYLGVALTVGPGVGCGDDEVLSPARTPLAELTAAGAHLTVEQDGAVALRLGDRVLLRLPPEAFAVGTVPELEEGRAYDPWTVLGEDPLGSPPAGLVWRTPITVELSASDGSTASLALDYGDGLVGQVAIAVEGPRRFSMAISASTSASGGEATASVAYHRLGARIDRAEGLYGLGEQLDSVSQRGKRRAMQLELDGTTESGNNEAHVPIPLLLGTTGWGMFVASDLVGAFDVATVEDDLVEVLYRADPTPGTPLRVHLFAEAEPLDLVGHYWDLTGAPALPAPWALGPLLWRDENVDQAEVLGDLEALRDLDLAATGFWIDRPYATAVNTFDFDPVRFPDAERMLLRAHQLGLRAALWHVPYLDEQAEATRALREEAEARGFFPPETSILLNGWGKPLDFTNPEATSWWRDQLGAYTRLGIEGYKLDYAEDIVPSIADARSVWTFADGSDERTMHARYARLYHEAYASELPDEGGLLLCRHANAGGQALGVVIWPGDLDATFARAGEPATDGDESYVSVGGLPASVVAGVTLSASGFPFYGADTGGYRHAPPDAELLVRWLQQTAFSTVMQVGNGASTVPWDPTYVTEEGVRAVDVFRRYGREHLRLFPYLWTEARRMEAEGRPIVRPVGLAYPELGQHPDDEYLLGPDLLVAPVVEREARSREVLFPPGAWLDWWTGQGVVGPTSRVVEAPLDEMPVYFRAGAFVPRLRTTIDTLVPTSEPDRVDSFATRAGPLWLRAFAGESAEGAVWDGTAITMDVSAVGDATIVVTPGSTFVDGAIVELFAWGSTAPTAVLVDGVAAPPLAPAELEIAPAPASGWSLDAAAGHLAVRLPPGAHEVRLRR